MRKWWPIDSAPVDDSTTLTNEFIGFNATDGTYALVHCGWMDDDKPVWFNGDVVVRGLTHWQPLPYPPHLKRP